MVKVAVLPCSTGKNSQTASNQKFEQAEQADSKHARTGGGNVPGMSRE